MVSRRYIDNIITGSISQTGNAPLHVSDIKMGTSVYSNLEGHTNEQDIMATIDLSGIGTLLVSVYGSSVSRLPYPGYHTMVYHTRVSYTGTGYNIGSIETVMNSDVGTDSQILMYVSNGILYLDNIVVAPGNAEKNVTYKIDMIPSFI